MAPHYRLDKFLKLWVHNGLCKVGYKHLIVGHVIDIHQSALVVIIAQKVKVDIHVFSHEGVAGSCNENAYT
jgi:hypothetical protein